MKKTSKILAVTLAIVITINLMITGLSAVSAAAGAPYAPANIRTLNSGTGFNITWNAAANATGYKVYYKTAESGWEFKNTNTNSIKLDDLEYGTLYYIQVQSIGANGVNGGFSKVSSMTHVRSTRLMSTAYNSNATVTVGWNSADGANGYAVAKKKAGDKNYTYYYTANTSFTDKNIEGGTIYYYQIRPYYTNGKSAAYADWSNTKTLITLYRPTITNVNSTNVRMNINWNSILGAKGYRLAFKRATDAAWNYRTVNTCYYNVPNPTKGATYYIQVCAVKDSLAGPYSAVYSHEITGKDTHEGLTYYKAGETITVKHPAENKVVWVVDEPAHDETVTEQKEIWHHRKCNYCGISLDDMNVHQTLEHLSKYHNKSERMIVLCSDGMSEHYYQGYVVEPVEKVIHVAEKGHHEVKQIKKAWDEKIEIKESGWYRTVVHAAETATIKTVNKAAYSYDEPVYYEPDVLRIICNECGADITEDALAHTATHTENTLENHCYISRMEYRQVQKGVKAVNIPEQSHYETKVVKEAWVEYVPLAYHEAGDTIKVTHPAETELVWVVDEAAHQETKIEAKSVQHYRICRACGAVGDGWTAERIREHDLIFHGIGIYWNGETFLRYPTSIPYAKPKSGNIAENVDKILNVAEKGHYEVKVTKKAWVEEITLDKSGWYKTVTHPAETAQAKVIDKAAYYYEEPVYEMQYKHLCWGCDAIMNGLTSEEKGAHEMAHHLNGEISGYRYVGRKVQIDSKKIEVPEQTHFETVTTKNAWYELVFVTAK